MKRLYGHATEIRRPVGFIFDEREAHTIMLALQIAANQYDQDATVCHDVDRLREQFTRQRDEVVDLAQKIEDVL